MEIINGYKLLETPRYSTCGQICKASKGRKTYLLKFFQNPVEPNAAIMDEKTYALARDSFESHKRRKTLLNQALRKNTSEGGNIVAPMEEFVSDGHWVEVTPFLSDTVAPENVISTFSGLDRNAQLMALKSVAASYMSLHSCGVVHGDAKLPNMLLRVNHAGNHVFAIIDFDGSFLTGDVPVENIVATLDYFSPEMGVFSNMDMEKRLENTGMITAKHDIFCLGLIFHQLLSGGKMPIPRDLPPHLQKRREKGKPIYLYTAMLASDDKRTYRAEVAPGIEPNLAALISRMLEGNPDDRPTADQVLRALNRLDCTEELDLPDAPFTWNREKLLADGFTQAEATERYGREGYLLTGFTRTRFMVPYRLFELGYASETAAGSERSFEESILTEGDESPWPEHRIAFNAEAIRRRNFDITRGTRKGVKGYRVKSADGVIRFMPSETLMLLGLARRA